MDRRRLLDSNLLIAFFDREQSVVERIIALDEALVPAIALGELHLGARCSQQVEENLERIDRLLHWVTVAPCDEDTAAIYGLIKQQLRAKGRMIPDNDIWIAAASRQTGAKLASRDQHFASVEQLDWEIW